jgi:hypothetical protein
MKEASDSPDTASNRRSNEKVDEAALSLAMRELLLAFVDPTPAREFDRAKYAATGRG